MISNAPGLHLPAPGAFFQREEIWKIKGKISFQNLTIYPTGTIINLGWRIGGGLCHPYGGLSFYKNQANNLVKETNIYIKEHIYLNIGKYLV